MHTHDAEVYERVLRILRVDFAREPSLLVPQATLRGTLMMDSLDLVDLVFFLQREFGLEARMEDYREIRSLDGLVKFVSSHAPGGRAPEASPGIA